MAQAAADDQTGHPQQSQNCVRYAHRSTISLRRRRNHFLPAESHRQHLPILPVNVSRREQPGVSLNLIGNRYDRQKPNL